VYSFHDTIHAASTNSHVMYGGKKSLTTTHVTSSAPVFITVIVYSIPLPIHHVIIFHVFIILTFPVPAGGHT
jgi:hypothetical protein